MLDSRQRDELNELIKYFSTRVAWFRLGLFISSLVQFATNGEIFAIYKSLTIQWFVQIRESQNFAKLGVMREKFPYLHDSLISKVWTKFL